METGVNRAVEAKIAQILKGKSRTQLIELENNVKDKLASVNPGDVSYWEYMLKVPLFVVMP